MNSNEAVQLRIEGTASDPWSTLRREYTGPRYLVHLLLTIAFLLPFAISVFHLSAVDEAYRTISTLAAERAGEPIDSAIPRAALRESVEAFDRHHVRVPSAAVLLGWPQGWWFLAMTAVVVAYNAMRVVLTIGIPRYWPGGVTALRDAEERSHITPSLEEYYGPLHPLTDGYKRHVLGWRKVEGALVPPERQYEKFTKAVKEAAWLTWVWAVPHVARSSGQHNRFKDFGLYRLQRVAEVLFWLAVAVFGVRALLWIIHSRVPIPVESLL